MTNKNHLESELEKIVLPKDNAINTLGNKYYNIMSDHVFETISQVSGVNKAALENIAWTHKEYSEVSKGAIADYSSAISLALDGKFLEAKYLLEERNQKFTDFGKECWEKAINTQSDYIKSAEEAAKYQQ